MEADMDEHIGYESYERSDNDIYLNGTKKREYVVITENLRQTFLRYKSSYEPKIIKKRQKDISGIDEKEISSIRDNWYKRKKAWTGVYLMYKQLFSIQEVEHILEYMDLE